MFTGIVAEAGRVTGVDRRSGYQRTTVAAGRVLDGLSIGDSISISGACHTAVAVSSGSFTVESVAETLRRTKMGGLSVGSRVNLERCVRLSDRLDGHLVQGHVDGLGTCVERRDSGDNADFTFEVAGGLGRYIAEKGSVAIDGVSLTVVSVDDVGDARSRFSVTLIPHTLGATTLGELTPGDRVNIEVDVIARYLERLGTHPSAHLGANPSAHLGADPGAHRGAPSRGLSAEQLNRAGSWGSTGHA